MRLSLYLSTINCCECWSCNSNSSQRPNWTICWGQTGECDTNLVRRLSLVKLMVPSTPHALFKSVIIAVQRRLLLLQSSMSLYLRSIQNYQSTMVFSALSSSKARFLAPILSFGIHKIAVGVLASLVYSWMIQAVHHSPTCLLFRAGCALDLRKSQFQTELSTFSKPNKTRICIPTLQYSMKMVVVSAAPQTNGSI